LATSVTPGEPVKILPSDKEWKIFEKDVANLTANMDSGTDSVTHDVKLPGVHSLVPRQVDILVKGRVNGIQMVAAIECKKFNVPVDVTHIDKFIGMLLDLRVNSGVFYAFGPVTPGARNRAVNAMHPEVTLKEMAGGQFLPEWSESLEELTPWGECDAPNCRGGLVRWRRFPQDDGDDIIAGECDFCGSWTVTCRDCENEEYAVDWEVTCSSCGAKYELTGSDYQSYDRDGVVQVGQGETNHLAVP
jgi:hypothetical protein